MRVNYFFLICFLSFACTKNQSGAPASSISNNKPVAAFDYIFDNNSQAPCTVSFINKSTNATSYKWALGNGTVGSTTNIQATYNEYRIFNVKLVATNSYGSDSVIQQLVINPIENTLVGYLITPKDNKFNAAYYNAVFSATLNLQSWYKSQMGNNKTFALNKLVIDTVTGLHDSIWYNNYNGSYSGTDPRYYGFYNTYYEVQQILGNRFNTSKYTYFVFVAAPGGGAGAKGFCAFGDQDLKGLLGINSENLNPNRWIGGDGHELGHAFGLQHPSNQNGLALMWTGYLTYPNCILQQEDKNILNANPIFK